ncbi:MAG TPA: hypothetical protein VMG32_01125 [Anaeromyxobacteraceae bacterium]|nr:hypothetical protein [Anaeromyxobacteraceae bacterium]
MRRPPRLRPLALLALLGCGSASDSACEDVGDCSQGGSASWIQSCQSAADAIDQASPACAQPFDRYFQCADDHYVCHGATASFPGCDAQLGQLASCLNGADAQSPCERLAVRTASCPGGSGSAPPGSPVPTACTLALQCQASCYLENVSNVCAPGLSELGAYTQCALSCPM